jgi:hypothetical protein
MDPPRSIVAESRRDDRVGGKKRKKERKRERKKEKARV